MLPETSLTLQVSVFLAQLDANSVLPVPTAPTASVLLSYKELSVKPPATLVSLLLDQSVRAVPLDAFSALKTSSASTALMVSTCTMALATLSAPPEPSETVLRPTGTASLAILLARPASTIPLTAQAAKMERDTSRPQLSTRAVSRTALTEPSLTMEFARFAISSVLPVSAVPPTASHALPTKFSIRVDALLSVPPFSFKEVELVLPLVLITALTVSTR